MSEPLSAQWKSWVVRALSRLAAVSQCENWCVAGTAVTEKPADVCCVSPKGNYATFCDSVL